MILVDEQTAVMEPHDFECLLEYSCSLPTGTTIGKQWKRNNSFGTRKPAEWWMGEYKDNPDPDRITIIWRKIEVISPSCAAPAPLLEVAEGATRKGGADGDGN